MANFDKLHFRGDSSRLESRWAYDEVEVLEELARRKKRRKAHPVKKAKPVSLQAMPWDTP